MEIYYGFAGLPNHWVNDDDKSFSSRFFEDKEYTEYYFDNFLDMDKLFGHENSLFGTRGLPVGHPDRSSRSFDSYNKSYGPMIVRVIKHPELSESIYKVKNSDMKKVIKLTEKDLSRLVKRVLQEQKYEVNQIAKQRFDKLSDNISKGRCVPVYEKGSKIGIQCQDGHYWELHEYRKFGN